jgi:hypothetical protein
LGLFLQNGAESGKTNDDKRPGFVLQYKQKEQKRRNGMKRKALLAACLLLGACLSGCTAAKDAKPAAAIAFVNEAEEADLWIVPDTPENRKTTVWGTATASGLGLNETAAVSLDALGGPGTYLIRMIGRRGMYYEVNGVVLEDGYTVRLRTGPGLEVTVEVTDADGETVATYEGFAARL